MHDHSNVALFDERNSASNTSIFVVEKAPPKDSQVALPANIEASAQTLTS